MSFSIRSGTIADSSNISRDRISQYTTNTDYTSTAFGFDECAPDYGPSIVRIISSSYPREIYGSVFEYYAPDYVMKTPLSASDILYVTQSQFFVGKATLMTASNVDSIVSSFSAFEAKSVDNIGLPQSISTLQDIVDFTSENVDPNPPLFPTPPPVGDIDLNRFRKTYTHVRVRPRIRKYSNLP